MPLTNAQREIWLRIADAYERWDPSRKQLMPIADLAEQLLDTVAPNAIGAVLAEASADGLAEVDSIAENPSFRLTSGSSGT